MAVSSIEYTVGKPMRGTRWVVRGKLGRGGMGLVLDVVKEGVIQGAMKVLHPHFAKLPEFAARFLEEVKVTARLKHVNIVQVLDFDRLEDGTPFMVMERLQGRTLGAALRETRQAGKCWTAANAYNVASQVSEGLYRAHSHLPSIVHRDIKPENLFLHRAESSVDSVVKVMDFGVAAAAGDREERRVGTPRYMAPEQVTGAAVSPQTDQYALGLVIYEMLTGRLPWDLAGRDASGLADVRRRAPPAPPSWFCPWLPERMEAALLKALSKDPAARHDTVHGLMFELRGLQSVEDPSGADDTNSTVPTVGTLAEGPETLDRMSVPPVEGGSLELFHSVGESGISVQFTEPPERPARAASSAPPEEPAGVTQEVRSAAQPPKAVAAPRTGSADRAQATAQAAASLSPHTPMSGESRIGFKSRGKVTRRGARTAALALVVTGAAALASAGFAGFSRGFGAKEARPTGSRTPGEGLEASALAREPGSPRNEVPSARESSVEVAAPAWLALPPTVAEAAALPREGGAGVAAARKPTSPAARPTAAARIAAPEPGVRDDGFDELYVPREGGAGVAAARKPVPPAARPAAAARIAAPKPSIPDDGRDELYEPPEAR
jgi:serine/threonine-protein kinase